MGTLEPWGLEAAVQSNLESFMLALTCSGARFFYLVGVRDVRRGGGGGDTDRVSIYRAILRESLFENWFRERVYFRPDSERGSIS